MRGRAKAGSALLAISVSIATASFANPDAFSRRQAGAAVEMRTGGALQQDDAVQANRLQAQVQERLVLDERILEQLREAEQRRAQEAAPQRDGLGRELTPIDWAAAERDWSAQLENDRSAWTSVAGYQRRPPTPEMVNVYPEQLERPSLPMLAPRYMEAQTAARGHPYARPGLMAFPHDHFYSCSMHLGELAVSVTGSRIVTRRIDEPGMRRGLTSMRENDGVRIQQTRYGVELTFTRYNAAYAIDIMCEDPRNTPECTDPATARQVYERLALAGGAPEKEGGRP